MARYAEPIVATKITNPTNQDLKYTWLGNNGMFVKAGSSITVPFDVHSAATPAQRPQLASAIAGKMVKLEVLVRKDVKVTQVAGLDTKIVVHDSPKVSRKAPAKAAETKEAPKREKIINAVEDGENNLASGEDLVQKATGQETVSMRDSLGWNEQETTDPRTPDQKPKDVLMEEALTENLKKDASEPELKYEITAAAQKLIDEEGLTPEEVSQIEAKNGKSLVKADVQRYLKERA